MMSKSILCVLWCTGVARSQDLLRHRKQRYVIPMLQSEMAQETLADERAKLRQEVARYWTRILQASSPVPLSIGVASVAPLSLEPQSIPIEPFSIVTLDGVPTKAPTEAPSPQPTKTPTVPPTANPTDSPTAGGIILLDIDDTFDVECSGKMAGGKMGGGKMNPSAAPSTSYPPSCGKMNSGKMGGGKMNGGKMSPSLAPSGLLPLDTDDNGFSTGKMAGGKMDGGKMDGGKMAPTTSPAHTATVPPVGGKMYGGKMNGGKMNPTPEPSGLVALDTDDGLLEIDDGFTAITGKMAGGKMDGGKMAPTTSPVPTASIPPVGGKMYGGKMEGGKMSPTSPAPTGGI